VVQRYCGTVKYYETWNEPDASDSVIARRETFAGFKVGLALIVLNPAAIATWVVIMGSTIPKHTRIEGLACTIGVLIGSSAWFMGGFQVYQTDMKTRLLGLDPALVAEHGVVSEAVAAAMAAAVRERTGATWGLSVTGEAGPEPSPGGPAPGTIWIGVAGPAGASAKLFRFPGDRIRIRAFAVQSALNLLRLQLAACA